MQRIDWNPLMNELVTRHFFSNNHSYLCLTAKLSQLGLKGDVVTSLRLVTIMISNDINLFPIFCEWGTAMVCPRIFRFTYSDVPVGSNVSTCTARGRFGLKSHLSGDCRNSRVGMVEYSLQQDVFRVFVWLLDFLLFVNETQFARTNLFTWNYIL